MVGCAIVALGKDRLQIGIQRRCRRETIAVEAHAVLDLKIVGSLVGITEGNTADELAATPYARRKLPAERRRLLRLEIRQRIVVERAERVDLLVQRERVSAQLSGELDAVLVAGAEPGKLIRQLGARRRLVGIEK